MSKLEILEMLRELIRTAVVSKTDPDDWSGANTVYMVDQEQLMRNLESAIEEEQEKCHQ